MAKKRCLIILSALFLIPFFAVHLHSAGTPADKPLITGIPIDEELAELLNQVVPYIPPEKDALPEEKRFLFNLNKLLDEDLAEQNDAYKLAVAKLALRTALAIHKMVDSIEVRRYGSLITEPYGGYSGKYGFDVKGNFYWVLGGFIENCETWGLVEGDWIEGTCPLFILQEGSIIFVDPLFTYGACGGAFSMCCEAGSLLPPGIDEIRKQMDNISPALKHRPTIVKNIFQKANTRIESLNFNRLHSSPITPEGIASLVVLKDLQHLTIDVREREDAEAMRTALLELFAQLPDLQTMEIDGAQIKRP